MEKIEKFEQRLKKARADLQAARKHERLQERAREAGRVLELYRKSGLSLIEFKALIENNMHEGAVSEQTDHA